MRLAQRRAELEAGDGYVAHRDRKVSQALKAYAAFARSADKGATRDRADRQSFPVSPEFQ